MTTLDQLGESSVPNLHISYIEGNAYFKFGVIEGCPFVFKFSSFYYLFFLVFSFSCLCILVVFFICFLFLGYFFFIFRLFLFWD